MFSILLFKLFCRKHFLTDFGFLFSSRVADTKKREKEGQKKLKIPSTREIKKAGTTNIPKMSRQYLLFKLPFCDLNHGLYFRITFLEKAFADAKVKDELFKGVLGEFRVWQKMTRILHYCSTFLTCAIYGLPLL